MKTFRILIFALLLIPNVTIGQIGLDEYKKYWYYRHRLTTEFMILGEGDHGCSDPAPTAYGYSLPAELTYGGTNTSGLNADKMIRYADATSYLGYYIAVLATEHKLLKEAGWDTEQTDKELAWAMKAFERLEKYSSLWFYDNGLCFINGYFIRDDIDITNFDENPIFNRYKVGGNYNYVSEYLHAKNHTTSSQMATVTNDQISHLFEGLALVKHCLEAHESYDGYFFRSRAINIAYRITNRLNSNKWYVKDDQGHKPGWNDLFRSEGHGVLVANSTGFLTGFSSDTYLSGVSKFRRKLMHDFLGLGIHQMLLRIKEDKRDFTYSHLTSSMAVGNTYGIGMTENVLALMDERYDLGYFTYLYNLLRNKSLLVSGVKYADELKNAPCYGITWRPANSSIAPGHSYYNGNSGWRARNRWIRFNERDGGTEFSHYKGNGLDYMILYNLYLLYYKTKDPSLVGVLPNMAPAHYLSVNRPISNLDYDLESYNTITLSSSINLSNTGTRFITANSKIVLKPGFSFKSQNGKAIVLSTRGNVNACGHPLDEFGEPIGNFPLRITENSSQKKERRSEYNDTNKDKKQDFRLEESYVTLDDYLKGRNGEKGLITSIYPNPSKNVNFIWLSLKGDTNQKVSVKMYDGSGSIVSDFGYLDVDHSSKEFKLGIEKEIKPGIYFIHISSTESKKVLKQIIL